MVARERPLSPHLQVYRPQITSILSIVHRLTGVALCVGTLLLVWWLVAAAAGPEAFDTVQGFIGSIFGRLILFGYTWALVHHMIGGIRHLIWDTGSGLEARTATRFAFATIALSVALTILIWVVGYAVR